MVRGEERKTESGRARECVCMCARERERERVGRERKILVGNGKEELGRNGQGQQREEPERRQTGRGRYKEEYKTRAEGCRELVDQLAAWTIDSTSYI